MSEPPNATELLLAWRRGQDDALGQLAPLVEGELHRLAEGYLRRERPDHTLQATALINEVYLRLIEINRVDWQNRAHFIAMAARLMRRILVDSARARRNQKRGGGVQRVALDDEALGLPAEQSPDVMAIDEALERLERIDPRRSRVVELRFFGGLSIEETAIALGVSIDTVKRDWRVAKLWMRRELSPVGKRG